jgi:citrate synthase
MTNSFKEGLEDVVVSTSEICFIDGRQGRLLYRGYDVDDLVQQSSFEEVVYLLWHGSLPSRKDLDAHVKTLSSSATRKLSPKLVGMLRLLPKKTTPMEVVRTGVSALSAFDPDAADNSREATIRKALRLTAQLPTLVAAWERLRRGKAPVAPNPRLNLAANFLYMLSGKKPSDLAAKTFDVALILHADHEFNASTFAARVTAATMSDLHSAIVSAIGALKGPLHGGANEEAMKMLEEVGDPANAERYIKERLGRRERIMGFGHRVYKTEDPRATHLRRLSRELGERKGDTRWFDISAEIERVVGQEKGLHANVDFFAASVYHYLEIPTDLMTPVFALARMVGWTAHVREQYADNRLIRPESEYVGPRDQAYVPIEARG